jgi:hypothetical protein
VPGTYIGEKTASSMNCAGKTGYPHVEPDSYLLTCTKFNSKWNKDLNIKPESLKLL